MSLNTVRTHTKNIYTKLAVTSRRAAVRRAQELDLLPGTRSRRPDRLTSRARRARVATKAAHCDEQYDPQPCAVPGPARALQRRAPPPESPHQSPDVVMPAHHIRS